MHSLEVRRDRSSVRSCFLLLVQLRWLLHRRRGARGRGRRGLVPRAAPQVPGLDVPRGAAHDARRQRAGAPPGALPLARRHDWALASHAIEALRAGSIGGTVHSASCAHSSQHQLYQKTVGWHGKQPP